MQVIIKKFAISQTQNHQMTSSWDSSIQIVQKFKNIGLEMNFSGHAVEWFRTDIISDQLKEHNQRIIILLISAEGMNVTPSVSTVTTIDSDVLVVVVVA